MISYLSDPVLVAQTVTQASCGVRKEDRMDVEPCYPLFSAELESAEALASSQQKFQTLYSIGPRHGDVRSLTEDWKVGPFVSRGVGLIPPRVRVYLQV